MVFFYLVDQVHLLSHLGFTDFCSASQKQDFLSSVLEIFALCSVQMQSVFAGLDQCSEEEKLQRLSTLKLRYFTPREVANLMGFPQSFCKLNVCLPLKVKAAGFSLILLFLFRNSFTRPVNNTHIW